MFFGRNKRSSFKRGNSLLELVAASTILATTMVPALRMMSDSLKVSRQIETANLMSTFCVSKLEERMAQTARVWATSAVSGNFNAAGYANIRFQVTRSDATSDGGIPGRLMTLTSTVWEDENGNGSWSTGEPRVIFATKLSRTASIING
ncbi:MAG: hypothetical protein ACI9G1_001059 [Pirellulaceae bacterium]|jgi:hypothetical protein